MDRLEQTGAAVQQLTLTEPAQHRYLLGELLGTGTAGKVVVGVEQTTGAEYAVKVLHKLRGQKDRTEQIKQEVRMGRDDCNVQSGLAAAAGLHVPGVAVCVRRRLLPGLELLACP